MDICVVEYHKSEESNLEVALGILKLILEAIPEGEEFVCEIEQEGGTDLCCLCWHYEYKFVKVINYLKIMVSVDDK